MVGPCVRLLYLALWCLGAIARAQAVEPEIASSAARPAETARDPDPAAFWAFQPVRRPEPPALPTAGREWVRTPVDAFVWTALESNGLRPAPSATRREWIRRVTFTLTGLPPAAEEVEALERDAAPDAYERVVQRLLASPHYGERWARWWLDVARYADTNGQDENKVMANAWRYRDWVVRAFNRNLRLDDFVTHQLAGDLLPAPAMEAEAFDRLIATGFLVLGPKMLAEQDKPKLVMDVVDEQIDTVGRAFLGLTLGCARCHDHKFDPVPARDYYALAGVFRSTRTMENLSFVSKFNERPIASAPEIAAHEAHTRRLAELDARIKALKGNPARGNATNLPPETQVAVTALEHERALLQATAPPAPAMALAASEDKPVDLPVHLRGSHLQLAADPVPRGVIGVVAKVDPAPTMPRDQSGRLEFARWLVSERNPLTARVLVNRVWQAHFAEGLVRTADNFGLRGEAPSHPELLDWLAAWFMENGWDLKALHRLILTSAVSQQSTSADDPSAAAARDPDNRLLTRYPRRRLDAEMIRDALLAVSGRLDRAQGGTLVAWKNNEYVPADDVSAASVRRTLYLPIVRDRVYDALTLFDFANPSVTTARRVPTVVSQQALFFLNSPLVRDCAAALAQASRGEAGGARPDRVSAVYRRVLGRGPTALELNRALEFLGRFPEPEPGPAEERAKSGASDDAWLAFCQAMLGSSEFLYRP